MKKDKSEQEEIIIDTAIKPFVDYLNNIGFVTFASCGSHLLTKTGKKIYTENSAYVGFNYSNENVYKLTNLIFHFLNFKKNRKNKNYEMTFVKNKNKDTGEHIAIFYIDFKRTGSRGKALTEIYKSLGINITKQIRFGRLRELTIKDMSKEECLKYLYDIEEGE